jgi:hypothetical protein
MKKILMVLFMLPLFASAQYTGGKKNPAIPKGSDVIALVFHGKTMGQAIVEIKRMFVSKGLVMEIDTSSGTINAQDGFESDCGNKIRFTGIAIREGDSTVVKIFGSMEVQINYQKVNWLLKYDTPAQRCAYNTLNNIFISAFGEENIWYLFKN